MKTGHTVALLFALPLFASLTAVADKVAVIESEETRVVATFDASDEITDVVVESKNDWGAWILNEIGTNDAEQTLADGADHALIGSGDCDGNGIADSADIAGGAEDRDRDGRLDICERINGDMNLNGFVDSRDVYYWMGIAESPFEYQGDLDGDGEYSFGDLAFILLNMGSAV